MPQTHLQWKRGNTASKPEDDTITVQKNEYQNTKQIFVIRHVGTRQNSELGSQRDTTQLSLKYFRVTRHAPKGGTGRTAQIAQSP